jgi:hypothetical protein
MDDARHCSAMTEDVDPAASPGKELAVILDDNKVIADAEAGENGVAPFDAGVEHPDAHAAAITRRDGMARVGGGKPAGRAWHDFSALHR